MKCPNCGEELLMDFDECPACGEELDQSTEKKGRKKRDIGSKIDSKISSVEETIEEKSDLELDEDKSSKELEVSSEIKSSTERVDDSHLRMVNLDDSDERTMEEIDEQFQDHFNFEFEDLWPDTHLCETLDEFAEKVVEQEQLSETAKEIKKEIEKRRSMKTKGISLADGFYINGWHFLEKYDLNSIEDIKENRKVWDEVVSTICHEKLGHGFIDLCTTAGKEIKETDLKKVELAREFDIDSPLTSEWGIAKEKWSAMFHSMVYLHEGYATWMENYIGDLLGLDSRNHHSWAQIERFIPTKDYEELKWLITKKESIELEDLYRIKKIGKENKKSFREIMGQPPRYVLGYLFFKELEEAVGPKNVPFAVSIACDVDYDLEDISVSDLEKLLENPRFNMDARILQLTNLELERHQKDDLEKLKKAAKEKLDMMVVPH